MSNSDTAPADHAKALANFAVLADGERAATAAVAAANAAKQALLNRAAGGDATVTGAAVMAANATVSEAEAALQVAAELAAAGKTVVEQSEIAVFAAAAADLTAQLNTLLSQASEAAAAVDAAVAAARQKLDALNAVAGHLGMLHMRARRHSEDLESAGHTNSVLAAQHHSLWPKAPTVPPLSGFSALTIELARPAQSPLEPAANCYMRAPLVQLMPTPAQANAA